MKRFLRAFVMFACLALPLQMWGQAYSLTPNQESTGTTSTKYITELTEFTYNGISWKITQWNPSSLQVKTNQSSATAQFRFYNTSAFGGRIEEVVLKFSALTVADASKLMFLGGSQEVTATTGGTAGVWDETNKTLTWTPNSSDNYTYFAFYQDGKAATGTNKLAETDAIVVTYQTNTPPTATTFPANNATGVLADVQPTFTFDKAVRYVGDAKITDVNVLVTFKNITDDDPANHSDVAFTASISNDSTVITVVPESQLGSLEKYRVSLAKLKDRNQNEMEAESIMEFTTRDANAMSIDNIAPVKTRYIWGEVAKLTWETSNLPATATGAIQVYRDGLPYGAPIPVYDTASLTPGSPTFAQPALVNGGYALVPLGSIPVTPADESEIYATNYSLVLTAFDGTTPLCVSEPVENITIIPAPALETIREYLPAFNGDSLLTTGVVTAVNGTSFAMQGVGAEKSGMYVYQAAGDKVAVGDSVAVLGVLECNTISKLWQIAKGSAVTRLAADKVLPVPIVRSLAESLLPADSVYQGMLVEISDVVTSVKGADDKADTLLSGANKMVVYNTFMTRKVLKSHFVADSTYRVRGIMSIYDTLAQICPRNSFDIAPAIAPVPVFAPANVDKVPLNTPITITFDRPMRKVGGAELTDADLASLIAFKDAAQDTAVLFAATICPSKDTIYIKPSVSLNGPIEYAVTLQPLEDYFGQAMATTTSSFTTLNPNSPHVENATIAAATRYLWGDDIVVNFDAKHYTSPTEGYAVLLRDGVRVDSVVIADITANTATFALGSGAPADGDTYSENYTVRVGSGADAASTTAAFRVIATPTLAVLNQAFDNFIGDTVALTGVVTGATWYRSTDPAKPSNGNAMIQDGAAPFSGFYLFNVTDSLGIGDSVRVITTVQLYNGIRETNKGSILSVLGKGTVPAPVELSIAEAAENKYQSMLVKIKNVKASVSNSNVSIEDNTASMTVYKSFYQDFASNFTNGFTYDVTGLMGAYNGVAQIYPRMAEDIVKIESGSSTTPTKPNGLKDNALKIKAYPNPFSNAIRVEGIDARHVEIYSVMGKLVLSEAMQPSGEVSTGNLPTGIYMVRFIDVNGKATVVKMVKR